MLQAQVTIAHRLLRPTIKAKLVLEVLSIQEYPQLPKVIQPQLLI